MKQKTSLRSRAKIFLLVGVLMAAFSCTMFEESESHISGPDKIACQQFSDSSFFDLALVPLTDFDGTWAGATVNSAIPAIIDSLQAHDLVVQASLDSAYFITRSGDSSYVALSPGTGDVTVFYTDMLDLNIYDASGALVEFTSDRMPLETISGCRDEEVETYEGNIIKIRLEYVLSGSEFLMQFIKTDNTKESDFYLTIQNSN